MSARDVTKLYQGAHPNTLTVKIARGHPQRGHFYIFRVSICMRP